MHCGCAIALLVDLSTFGGARDPAGLKSRTSAGARRLEITSAQRVFLTSVAGNGGAFSSRNRSGLRTVRGSISICRIFEEARNTGSSDSAVELRDTGAPHRAGKLSPAKNGCQASAPPATPLRRASEIPSPTNGSTKPAASPTIRTLSRSGCGSRKIKGEVLTGSLSESSSGCAQAMRDAGRRLRAECWPHRRAPWRRHSPALRSNFRR